MVTIIYGKQFKKQYKKIIQTQPKRREKIIERIQLFTSDRSNPILADHALVGKMEGKRSFSVAGDLRIIYSEENAEELTILFLAIGSHNQVY